MYKIILLIALFFSLTYNGNAQKRDKFYCGKFYYELPPSDTLLYKYDSYYLSLIMPNVSLLTLMSEKNKFKLKDFEQNLGPNEYGFKVKVKFSEIDFKGVKELKQKVKKEENGVDKSFYLYEISEKYSFNYNVKVLDNSGLIIYEDYQEIESDIKGKKGANKSKATASFNNVKSNLKVKILTAYIIKIATKIETNFCYLDENIPLRFYKIKPKKYKYDDYNTKLDSIKTMLINADRHVHINDMDRIKIIETIDFYNKVLMTGDPNNKKARINATLIAQTYYNIGMLYFLLEDYDQVIYNFDRCRDKNNALAFNYTSYYTAHKKLANRQHLIRKYN